MSRKLLFLASFFLMAAPLISSVATPAVATSLYSEQRQTSALGSSSFSSNSVLISDRYDRDRDYNQNRRRSEELRRDLRRDAQELRELRNRDSDRYRRDRNYDPYQRYRYDRYDRGRNYDPYYRVPTRPVWQR